MSYYCLDENMRVCTKEELHEQSGYQYVTVLTTHEWNRERDFFDMGIELEPDTEDIL
ncbi:MAG: hypothetical protein IJI25_07555 [Eubacterium sp.]|nr:hypothetical protein [Eubacterium sp.]